MIEFEHTLFILLLLSSVLIAKPPRQRWAVILILVSVLLVFIPPAQSIQFPWELFLGLIIPLVLWQNVRRLVNADWRGWNSVIFWGATVLIFGLALWLGGSLNWIGAVLFGMIAASMIWRAGEPESGSSYMSQVGPLTLIFLLTEVEAAIQLPNSYAGGIFSGAFFGILAALLGVYLVRKAPERWYSWICLGQVYLAYWFSFAVGVSAVSAAVVSVLTFVLWSQYDQNVSKRQDLPSPLNTWPGFGLVLALFLLLGWQAHQTVTTLLLVEVLLGGLLGFGVTWLGCRLNIPAFHKQKTFWWAGLRTAALLFPALLIWPRDLLQEPIQLAVAIGISAVVIGLSHLVISRYFPEDAVPEV